MTRLSRDLQETLNDLKLRDREAGNKRTTQGRKDADEIEGAPIPFERQWLGNNPNRGCSEALRQTEIAPFVAANRRQTIFPGLHGFACEGDEATAQIVGISQLSNARPTRGKIGEQNKSEKGLLARLFVSQKTLLASTRGSKKLVLPNAKSPIGLKNRDLADFQCLSSGLFGSVSV